MRREIKLQANCTHVMYCCLLFQSLVRSPEPRANLPKYLEELKNTVRQEQTTRNISSADLGTVVVILDKISPIPANATETNIEVRLYFKSYLYLSSPLAPFVMEDDILPEEISQVDRVRNTKVLRE